MPKCSFESEIFKRPKELVGEHAFARLNQSSVLIVGLGGVGSHAASALARSGVGHLHLVDFDAITESSLGRMALVGSEDIEKNKAEAIANRLKGFLPLEIEITNRFFHHDSADEILKNSPSLVIDAIDSVNPKVELILTCIERDIPIISSMGAAGRMDPTQIKVDDISKTKRCPLARTIRKRLKRRGLKEGVLCVYSTEEPAQVLPPDEDEPHYERGRKRNRLPNLIVMPGIFGYSLASIALRELTKDL